MSSNNIRRRDFLKRSTLSAAAALALPAFIPRHALGFAGTPGANEQIVLGIVGMGVRGDQLVLNVPKSGRVAAVCDADARKTAAVTEKHKTDWKIYQDYRKLVEQKDLDAVMVAACDHHHVLASVLACQAGKDVYCEKPLSLYIREGRALVTAARKHERVVQTGTQQRTMEMNRFACEFVPDGVGQLAGLLEFATDRDGLSCLRHGEVRSRHGLDGAGRVVADRGGSDRATSVPLGQRHRGAAEFSGCWSSRGNWDGD